MKTPKEIYWEMVDVQDVRDFMGNILDINEIDKRRIEIIREYAREMSEEYVKWWAKKIQYPNPAEREPFTYDMFLSENGLQEGGDK
jgi:hypothetical protein